MKKKNALSLSGFHLEDFFVFYSLFRFKPSLFLMVQQKPEYFLVQTETEYLMWFSGLIFKGFTTKTQNLKLKNQENPLFLDKVLAIREMRKC